MKNMWWGFIFLCALWVNASFSGDVIREPVQPAVVPMSNPTTGKIIDRRPASTRVAKERELRAAASKGDAGYVKELLKSKDVGVDSVIEGPSFDRSTALLLASRNGHLDVVKILSDAGANIHYKNRLKQTALILASVGGHPAVVNELLTRGARVDQKGDHDNTALMFAIMATFPADKKAEKAFEENQKAVITTLLEHGADLFRVVNDRGETAVNLIEIRPYGRDLMPIVTDFLVRRALQSGVDAAQRLMLEASSKGHTAIVAKLLDYEPTLVMATYREGSTPIMYASKKGHVDIVHILLDHGASVIAKNTKGKTALMYASELGSEPVVTMLLQAGSNPAVADNEGNTAVSRAKDDAIKELLNNPPAVNNVWVEKAAQVANEVAGVEAEMVLEVREHEKKEHEESVRIQRELDEKLERDKEELVKTQEREAAQARIEHAKKEAAKAAEKIAFTASIDPLLKGLAAANIGSSTVQWPVYDKIKEFIGAVHNTLSLSSSEDIKQKIQKLYTETEQAILNIPPISVNKDRIAGWYNFTLRLQSAMPTLVVAHHTQISQKYQKFTPPITPTVLPSSAVQLTKLKADVDNLLHEYKDIPKLVKYTTFYSARDDAKEAAQDFLDSLAKLVSSRGVTIQDIQHGARALYKRALADGNLPAGFASDAASTSWNSLIEQLHKLIRIKPEPTAQ